MAIDTSAYKVSYGTGTNGAGSWEGNLSNQHLYGAELSKAIRTELKKCGIKGVTVSSETYTGGQRIYIKIRPTEADFVPLDEYVQAGMEPINFYQFGNQIAKEDGSFIDPEDCYSLPDKERYALHKKCLIDRYNRYFEPDKYGVSLSERIPKWYEKIFSKEFLERFQAIVNVVNAFNHDDSDSMTDYFDRGFYEWYTLMPRKASKK